MRQFTKRVYQEDLDGLLVAGRSLDLSRAPGVDLNALGVILAHLRGGGAWTPPASSAVRTWLNQIGFDAALGGAPPRGRHSDVLLELTPMSVSEDLPGLLAIVSQRAFDLLRRHLGYDENDLARFTVALSELCQNIPEHAGARGWAAIQKYVHRGRNIVKIAVVDSGRGVRASLGERLKLASDSEALETALLKNVSRFDVPGRGNGLREVRRLAEKWGAKLTMRSGTARLSVVPAGMTGTPRAEGLAFVPGTQVLMSFPAIR